MLGGIGGRRRRGRQRLRWFDGITDSMDMSLSTTLGVGGGQAGLACCDSWGNKESDMTERLNRTEALSSNPGSPTYCGNVLRFGVFICITKMMEPHRNKLMMLSWPTEHLVHRIH